MGLIGKPHGVRGEVSVAVLTDYPDRFVPGARFVVAEDGTTLEVERSRTHHGKQIIAFAGVADRDAAEALRGATLTIAADERRPLDSHEYWPDDLEGMTAVGRDGVRLGTITGVVLGDHQDRLVVETASGSVVEVPFVEPIVGEVHPSGGFIVMDPPEGLF